jgi:polysaccharide export outer membrane protein
MKSINAEERKIVLFFTLFIFFLSSCTTQRNVEYFQNKNKGTKSFNEAIIEDYKLKSDDELFIQISSLDDAASNIFTGTRVQQSIQIGSLQPYGASLLSYTVDKEGYLHLPVIGKLLVIDKTLADVSSMIKESLTNVLSQPVVSLKLVNRYVSVLGEVQYPGHFAYAKDKLTIPDALSLAGDITEYGNRKEVVLIRNEKGKNIRIIIDITKSDILASEYYYIRPNDIIYIKPLRKKFWGLRQFPYTVIFSTLTTVLLIYNVMK